MKFVYVEDDRMSYYETYIDCFYLCCDLVFACYPCHCNGWVYTGNQNGTFNEGVNHPSTRGHDPLTYPTDFFVANVNGDGKDDFIVKCRHNTVVRFLTYRWTDNGLTVVRSATFTNEIPYFNVP